MKKKTGIRFADLFAGAAGATTSIKKAAKEKGLKIKSGVLVNHWQLAVDSSKENHPELDCRCESIEAADPNECVPGGYLDILWASPECTHHSQAAGGRPKQNQSRSGASHVLTWADKLYIKNILIENVPAFENWGPLDTHGHPIQSMRGTCFQAFLESLRARNYNVDYRIIRAADYGDATTRERLFIMARRKPLKCVWPEPLFRPEGSEVDLWGPKPTWKGVDTCIDFTDLGTPLHEKKFKKFMLDGKEVLLPLCPNTLARIEQGLKEFCGLQFVFGQQSCAMPRKTSEPAPTIATKGAISLVTCFLVQTDQTGSNGKCISEIKKPMGVIVTKQNVGILSAILIPKDVRKKIEAGQKHEGGFLITLAHGHKTEHTRRLHSLKKPSPTLTTKGQFGLAHFIVQMNGTTEAHLKKTAHSVKKPLPTLAGSDHHALASIVVEYYGNGGAHSVKSPAPTITTHDRFGVVTPAINKKLELVIFFRLLKLRELARVHSFPENYIFKGKNKDGVKMVGNSNPVCLGAELTKMVL